MKVSAQKLLLIAGIVWLVAGLNIINIGLQCYFKEAGPILIALLLATLVIYVVFHIFVFSKMVGKHNERILGYEEDKVQFWKFFDKKSYIIMAVMMGGGIGLRVSGLIPDWFIAFFYTGLGFALGLAGVSFIIRYRKAEKASCPFVFKKKD